MSDKLRIASIRFRNYKAFADYAISFGGFNVLVGPNFLLHPRAIERAIRKRLAEKQRSGSTAATF